VAEGGSVWIVLPKCSRHKFKNICIVVCVNKVVVSLDRSNKHMYEPTHEFVALSSSTRWEMRNEDCDVIAAEFLDGNGNNSDSLEHWEPC
jgi:hypothetical protein